MLEERSHVSMNDDNIRETTEPPAGRLIVEPLRDTRVIADRFEYMIMIEPSEDPLHHRITERVWPLERSDLYGQAKVNPEVSRFPGHSVVELQQSRGDTSNGSLFG